MPDIKVKKGKWQGKGKTAILFVYKNLKVPKVKNLDAKKTKKALQLAEEDGFQGERNSVALVHPPGEYPSRRLLLVGLGEKKKISGRIFREAVGTVFRKYSLQDDTVYVILPPSRGFPEKVNRIAQIATEGILLGTYNFKKYFESEEARKEKIKTVHLFSSSSKRELEKGIERGRSYSEATMLVRDLVNEPASVCTPAHLAEVALDLAEKHKEITAKVWDEEDLQEEGFGGTWGVGRGSDSPPRFIRLEYKPKGKAKKSIALVGKGVTFDTGGVNIKPTSGIETMKEDMSGAGAVLGVFSALPYVKPKVRVVGLIPSAENMVGGFSFKPGDILKSYGGKSMEIINTDAEGRLLLADALSYCIKEEKVDGIIDMATLTGAAVLALGKQYTAMFTTEKDFGHSIIEAGERSGERLWEFPLVDEYKADLKSEFADIKNAPATRLGGTIHGALFLYFFLEESGIPWTHIDIAPSAWSKKKRGHISYGGTGSMVRTLLEYFSDEDLWQKA